MSLLGGRVVCCSRSEADAYRSAGMRSLIINNGVRPAGECGTTRASSRFTIVTAARISSQKNPALFNRIALFFERFPAFHFLWVGEGDDRDLLHASNINITGWVSPEECRRLVQSADLYLSTSDFEGL